jgi:hypothetical protein
MPRSSRNFGLASAFSQNQRDVNQWVPDQDCTERDAEFPTQCSQFFQSQTCSVRTKVIVMQDELVFGKFIEEYKAKLELCLDIVSSICIE